MRKIFTVLMAFAAVGCDKSEKEQADCERNNYGSVQFAFLTHQESHKIQVVNAAGNIVREKTVAAGTTGDTLRLAPGNYFINSYSIFSGAEPSLVQTDTISLTLCKDRLQLFIEY